MFQEELTKHSNEAGTSQSTQKSQSHMRWKNDIYSQVQGSEKKKERVRCLGKIPKAKKAKVVLSENQQLHNRLRQLESMMTNVLTLIQNRFAREEVNDIFEAARQDTDTSSVPGQINSPSSDTNEDIGANED